MLGKFLSKALDVAVFPVKLGEELLGMSVGASRRQLKEDGMPLPTDLTDKIREALENADKED
jgi:hypothetical protein